MLANFDTPIERRELLRRTLRETRDDNGLGLAAQLAYYFFLALFPALLFLVALAGFFPVEDVTGRLIDAARGIAPPAILDLLRSQVRNIAQGSDGGILTFGILAALWSSSAAMVALIGAMNHAFDVEESRAWWRQRLTAVLLTVGAALFVLVSFTLVVAGPQLGGWIAAKAGLGGVFTWTWRLAQWPVVFLLIATAIGLVYHFAPNVDHEWRWLTPGSLLATLLWIAGTIGVRYYVVNFGSYQETYGAIGGVVVLLLWLYLSGLVIFVGAEMNSEIAHAAAGETPPLDPASRERAARRPAPAAGGHESPAASRPAAAAWTLAAAPILVWLWVRRVRP